MSVNALLLPERLRWKVCLYYFCFGIFPCFVLDTSPLMSHVCAQGFETLAQISDGYRMPRILRKPRHHHRANARRTVKLLKRATVPVKTSASYHCSPTNTLINPPLHLLERSRRRSSVPCYLCILKKAT